MAFLGPGRLDEDKYECPHALSRQMSCCHPESHPYALQHIIMVCGYTVIIHTSLAYTPTFTFCTAEVYLMNQIWGSGQHQNMF